MRSALAILGGGRGIVGRNVAVCCSGGSTASAAVGTSRANLVQRSQQALFGSPAYALTSCRGRARPVGRISGVSRSFWTSDRHAAPTVAESSILDRLRAGDATVELEDVVAVIDSAYDYQPVAFTNGAVENYEGSNAGSSKLLAWAILHGLTRDQVLLAYGRHYRNLDPNGTDHPNIREIEAKGLVGVDFEVSPLLPK
eukprot:SAG31_NODE_313_length_17858_cov_34.811307_6_plen_198_part_00